MRRVLVVDDDPHFGVAIRAWLAQRGFNARGSMKAEAARR
jgi:DNA-binding response OmpR family regulator